MTNKKTTSSQSATRLATGRQQAYIHHAGHYALRYWLRVSGQRALNTRPQWPRTTQAAPVAIVAKNRLLGQPAPTRPNQV